MSLILSFPKRLRDSALGGNADYYDAIKLGTTVASLDGFFPEGGAKNVARRDGIATTMLSAVEAIGRLPDYYFQAIGSGTGGIAVHEAAKRLVADRRFGQHLPRLFLSQNLPFAPIYSSWKTGKREFSNIDNIKAKQQIQQMAAQVLSNQVPPYSIFGGVFDALSESQGRMFAVENQEVMQAMAMFGEREGIDIDPAAGVALASLLKARQGGCIEQEATVLLHITSGGWNRLCAERQLEQAVPDLWFDGSELVAPEIPRQIAALF